MMPRSRGVTLLGRSSGGDLGTLLPLFVPFVHFFIFHRPEHFVPAFEHQHSNPQFGVNGPIMYEKLVPHDRPVRGSFLVKLFGWPAVIVFGQLILQFGAWGFFAAVRNRDFIALPHEVAHWIRTYGHVVTALFTLLSTALAAISTSLFSGAVRQSITLRLRGKGMSLGAFASAIELSSLSLIFDSRKRKMSALSITLIALTGLQTSGWSSLLTPQVLVVSTAMTALELNLASPDFPRMLDQGTLDSCVRDSANLSPFAVGQTESGFAAVKKYLGFPSLLTLMDQSFNSSTAGILPATLRDIDASSWFPSMTTIPSTLSAIVDLSNRRPLNYTMFQQGFTADVTCQFQNLTDSTSPSLSLVTNTNNNLTSGDLTNEFNFFTMTSDCPFSAPTAVNGTSAYTVGSPNFVMMIPCGGFENDYTLLFRGEGEYDFIGTMECNFSPKIIRVQVEYSDVNMLSGTISPTTLAVGEVPELGGPAGLSAVLTVSHMVSFAQAVHSNIMGAELQSLGPDLAPSQNDVVLRVMEEYIRGVAEYSGSVFRACLSARNETSLNSVPDNISIETQGFLSSQIVGWRVSGATVLVLIPGTIVALLTIYIMLVSVAHHIGDPAGDPFDPGNAMHLVSASAAGDLNYVFTGTEEAHITAAESVNIILQTIIGRSPALTVRSATV